MLNFKTEERKNEVVELCQRIVRAESYSGNEGEVAKILTEYMQQNGFDSVTVDDYGNIIGSIKGKREGKKLLFDGHMDTVPVTDPSVWTMPPFGAEIKDGKIYGRGTADMKGAVAASLVAFAAFAKDTGKDFAGELYFAGIVHEECFEGIGASAVGNTVSPDYVIIGEASELNLKVAQRGRAEIVIETKGIPCHSANPEKGLNAVYKMTEVIPEIRKIVPPEHPILGKGILELTDIKSSPYPGASVVPEYCRATYDRRLLVGETKESVLAPINEVLDRLMAKDPDLKVRAYYAVGTEKCYTGNDITGERFFPGWVFEKDSDYVVAVHDEMVKAGYSPEITKYNFCTNGSHYAGEAGIKTFGLGVGPESLAHTVDEYVEIEELFNVAECYYLAAKALLK